MAIKSLGPNVRIKRPSVRIKTPSLTPKVDPNATVSIVEVSKSPEGLLIGFNIGFSILFLSNDSKTPKFQIPSKVGSVPASVKQKALALAQARLTQMEASEAALEIAKEEATKKLKAKETRKNLYIWGSVGVLTLGVFAFIRSGRH